MARSSQISLGRDCFDAARAPAYPRRVRRIIGAPSLGADAQACEGPVLGANQIRLRARTRPKSCGLLQTPRRRWRPRVPSSNSPARREGPADHRTPLARRSALPRLGGCGRHVGFVTSPIAVGRSASQAALEQYRPPLPPPLRRAMRPGRGGQGDWARDCTVTGPVRIGAVRVLCSPLFALVLGRIRTRLSRSFAKISPLSMARLEADAALPLRLSPAG
jgi:hypothetical protein